jgi:hypothetical protein
MTHQGEVESSIKYSALANKTFDRHGGTFLQAQHLGG